MFWEVEGGPSAEERESTGTVVVVDEEMLLREEERKSWPASSSASASPKMGRRGVPRDESKMPDIVGDLSRTNERDSRETMASVRIRFQWSSVFG